MGVLQAPLGSHPGPLAVAGGGVHLGAAASTEEAGDTLTDWLASLVITVTPSNNDTLQCTNVRIGDINEEIMVQHNDDGATGQISVNISDVNADCVTTLKGLVFDHHITTNIRDGTVIFGVQLDTEDIANPELTGCTASVHLDIEEGPWSSKVGGILDKAIDAALCDILVPKAVHGSLAGLLNTTQAFLEVGPPEILW